VAEALVAKGLATVVRYAQGNENRSSQYDQLLAAEAKAEKSRKGVHSLKSPADSASPPTQHSKELPIVRVQELQGVSSWPPSTDPARSSEPALQERSKQFFPFLQRAGRSEGVVEFVASGSRLRVYVPKETCLLTFLLSGNGPLMFSLSPRQMCLFTLGISCPRAPRANVNAGEVAEGEPFGQEALQFIKDVCLQREVSRDDVFQLCTQVTCNG